MAEGGTTTKDDGTFILKQAKDKSCIIKISGLGYSPVYMQHTDSLANITLQDITYNVGEVSVVGKRPTSKTVDGNITFFVIENVKGILSDKHFQTFICLKGCRPDPGHQGRQVYFL